MQEKAVEFTMGPENRYLVTLRKSGDHSVQFVHSVQIGVSTPEVPIYIDPDTQEWRNAVARAIFLNGEKG